MRACLSIVLVHFLVKVSFKIFKKKSVVFFPGEGHLSDLLYLPHRQKKKKKELTRVQFEEIHGPPEHNNRLAEQEPLVTK